MITVQAKGQSLANKVGSYTLGIPLYNSSLSLPRKFPAWLFIPKSRNGFEYGIIFYNFSAFPSQWVLFKTLPISHFVCGVYFLPGPCDLSSLCPSPGLTVPGALCPVTILSWLHLKCMSLSISPRYYFPQARCYSLSSVPGSASLCTCPSHYRHEHSWLTLMNKHNSA